MLLFCLIFQFYLMYRLICQKPAHFLSAQMALVSTFFQMFTVLGMYDFEAPFKLALGHQQQCPWEIHYGRDVQILFQNY